MSFEAYRRQMGAALGAAVGLAYGLASQWINQLVLPGVPFYHPAPGPAMTILLLTLFGAAVGLVSAWAESSWAGALLGGVLSAVVIDAANFARAYWTPETTAGIIVSALFLLVPLTGMVVVLVALLRWAVNTQANGRRDHDPIWRRSVAPLVVLALALGAGSLQLYRPDARTLLRRTDVFLRAAATAGAEQIPAALDTADVGDYLVHSDAPYTLEWTRDDLNRYRIPRPGGNFDNHSVVIAHYADNWTLVCLYVDVNAEPVCKGFGAGEL
jgi:hypothetical protein